MLKLFSRKRAQAVVAPTASIGEDRRVYAIGDIHGRLDLFENLLMRIDADNVRRPAMETHLILLGDLVDRGLESAGVVARALEMAQSGKPVRFLKGNHEEVFLRAASGDEAATRFLIRIGGKETVISYGLPRADYDAMDFAALTDWLLNHVPRAHVDFLAGFEDMIEMGDYLFVHAGIRPDVPLEDQKPSDLRWIREEFLTCPRDHGKVVVHGHTITEHVEEYPNRIGIDTGAFASERLTAVGLEGHERWYLSTMD